MLKKRSGDRNPSLAQLPSALNQTLVNTKGAGVAASVNEWDARALPIPDGSIDPIVSKLPWGRQAPIDGSRSLFYRKVCAEMLKRFTN